MVKGWTKTKKIMATKIQPVMSEKKSLYLIKNYRSITVSAREHHNLIWINNIVFQQHPCSSCMPISLHADISLFLRCTHKREISITESLITLFQSISCCSGFSFEHWTSFKWPPKCKVLANWTWSSRRESNHRRSIPRRGLGITTF